MQKEKQKSNALRFGNHYHFNCISRWSVPQFQAPSERGHPGGHFHNHYACHHLRDCFPNLVSYNRFIELSHRSIAEFLLNRISAIAAYSSFPKKPSIKKDIEETNPALIAQHDQPKLIAA